MRERGFSLVETLVAVGVTSTILLSIAGMFVMGTKEIESGRNLTEGSQAGQGLIEEIQTMHRTQIYGLLNGATTDTTVTWSSDTAVPTYTGANTDFATDYAAILNRWRTQVQDSVPRSGYSIKVDGFVNRPTSGSNGTSTFGAARFVRVELTIFWKEGAKRSRNVVFDFLKF